ncbi:MAG: hypothetical protein AB8H80_21075 [Planctomycetota bacterium]
MNNYPTIKPTDVPAQIGSQLQDVLRSVLDRTHTFAADGTTTVVDNRTGEVRSQGWWRLVGNHFEIGTGDRVGLRGHYYGDEIHVSPTQDGLSAGARIVLRRK